MYHIFLFFKYLINILLTNVKEIDLLVAKYTFIFGAFLLMFNSLIFLNYLKYKILTILIIIHYNKQLQGRKI